MNALSFWLGGVSFTSGGIFSLLLRDALARQRKHKLTQELKESESEILRLRAQVAKHIGHP